MILLIATLGTRPQTLAADPQRADTQAHPVGLDPFVDARGEGSYFVTQALSQRIELIRHLLEFGRQIIVVTGSQGAGKTSLLDRVTDSGEKNWRVLRYIAGPTLNRPALLDKVAGDLGLDKPFEAAARIEENIRERVLSASRRGETIILAIDDAHRLPADTPGCIAKLAHCVDESTEIKVVLSADPAQSALADQLQSESSQHALVHIVETPRFNGEQIVAMLTHRWKAAYGTQEIPLDSSDMAQIAQASSGIPGKAIVLARQVQSLAKNAQRRQQTDPARRFLIVGVAFVVLFSLFAFFYADGPSDTEEAQISVRLPAEQIAQPIPSKDTDSTPDSRNDGSELVDSAAVIAGATANEIVNVVPPETDSTPDSRNDGAALVGSAPEIAGAIGNEIVNVVPPEPELPQIIQATEEAPPSVPIITPTPETTAPPVELIDENDIPEAVPTVAEPTPITPAIKVPIQTSEMIPNPKLSAAYSIKWLRTRPAGGYVLQLFGVRDRTVAVKFIRDRKIGEKSTVLVTNHAGAPWYVVVYGYYPDRGGAQAEIKDLPPKLTTTKPWARPIASLN